MRLILDAGDKGDDAEDEVGDDDGGDIADDGKMMPISMQAHQLLPSIGVLLFPHGHRYHRRHVAYQLHWHCHLHMNVHLVNHEQHYSPFRQLKPGINIKTFQPKCWMLSPSIRPMLGN